MTKQLGDTVGVAPEGGLTALRTALELMGRTWCPRCLDEVLRGVKGHQRWPGQPPGALCGWWRAIGGMNTGCDHRCAGE